jgi:DNA polymerase-3 subunit beta
MELTIAKKDLFPPLKLASSVIGVSHQNQSTILSHYLFSLTTEGLSITAGDGELELRYKFPLAPSEYSSGVSTAIPHKLLDIVGSLPPDTLLHFSQKKDQLLILKAGKSRFTLKTLPAEDYPEHKDKHLLAELDRTLTFTIATVDLKYFLSNVAFCMASTDVRQHLVGAKLELRAGQLFLATTDGYRLAVTNSSPNNSLGDTDLSAIIPRKAVLELLKLLPNTEQVTLLCTENYCQFSFRDYIVFTTRLLVGTYPDWRAVIPQHANMVLVADTSLLKSAIRRVMLLSSERHKCLRLVLSENLLQLYATNSTHEEAFEELTVDYTGSPLKIGFNGQYLYDVLNVISSDTARFAFTDANSSVLITQHETDEFTRWVVMPIIL